MIDEKIIENAENVIKLIEQGILEKDEVRRLLCLREKLPVEWKKKDPKTGTSG